jgi:hypothetical protein
MSSFIGFNDFFARLAFAGYCSDFSAVGRPHPALTRFQSIDNSPFPLCFPLPLAQFNSFHRPPEKKSVDHLLTL